jgi:PAS domain-containing protein
VSRSGSDTVSTETTTGVAMTLPEEQTQTSPQEHEEAAREVNDLLESPEFAMAIETEKFKLFLDHLPIGIVISKRLRGDHRILFANKAYEHMTGQRISDLRGRDSSILDAFIDEDDPNVTTQALCDTSQCGPHFQ